MQVTFKQILVAGGPVLGLLALVSIYSIAIMWERWVKFKHASRGMPSLIKETNKFVDMDDMKRAADIARTAQTSAGDILYRAITCFGDCSERRQAVEKAIDWHAAGLQKNLAVLATIGSVSPFVGLFGTVLGVMRAFKDLASYAGAGPSVVAVGIAEALVNTAAGLFVAIPAVIAYNYFVNRTHDFVNKISWAGEEIIVKTSQQKELSNVGT